MIVVDSNNKVEMVLGASGGPGVLSASLAVLVNSAIFHKDAKDSIAESRTLALLDPNAVRLPSYPFNTDIVGGKKSCKQCFFASQTKEMICKIFLCQIIFRYSWSRQFRKAMHRRSLASDTR
jgi:hypothetical protein